MVLDVHVPERKREDYLRRRRFKAFIHPSVRVILSSLNSSQDSVAKGNIK